MGHTTGVEHHFHHIRIKHLAGIVEPLAQRSDLGFRVQLQVLCHLVDQGRRNQRLVALYIHHPVVGIEPKLAGHFFQPVGATGVVR